MSLSSLHWEEPRQDVFFKVIRREKNGDYYPYLVGYKPLEKNVWNKADNCVLETSMHGALYTSGFHSFFIKDDAFKWLGKKSTRKHTNIELWEVEVEKVLTTGYSLSLPHRSSSPLVDKFLTIVSDKLKLRRKICCLLDINIIAGLFLI